MKQFIEALKNGEGFSFLTDYEKYSELTKDEMRDIAKELINAIEKTEQMNSDIQAYYDTAEKNLKEQYDYEFEEE